MKATQQPHDLGRSLWRDIIARAELTSSTLDRPISELSVTGLTSNRTIFDHTIRDDDFHDAAIRNKARAGFQTRCATAGTGTTDPAAPEVFHVEALAAPDTIDTMPEKTLLACPGHGRVKDVMRLDAGHAKAMRAQCARAGGDIAALAAELQHEGTAALARAWDDPMVRVADKTEVPAKARRA